MDFGSSILKAQRRFLALSCATLCCAYGDRARSGRSAAEPDPKWLTVRWLPLTLPAQLVLHELSHAATVPLVGGRVTRIGFLEQGHLGMTHVQGVDRGLPLFVFAAAPRLLNVAEMVIFTRLFETASRPETRGFYNAMRLSAWVDFEFNTCKTLGPHTRPQPLYAGAPIPTGPSGNDGWDTAAGLGLGDAEARGANAVVAVGAGIIAFHWIF